MTRALQWGSGLLLATWLCAALLPFALALLGSLLPEASLFSGQLAALQGEHYRALFGERDFLVPLRNSLLVAGVTTLLSLVVGSPCAYALARLSFPGKAPLLACILAVSMFPQISVVPPLYLTLRSVGLINTYAGLVLPYLTFALPLTVWVLTGFFRALPRELEEAAALDGAGRLTTFLRIVLPLAAPGLAATGILTFLSCWNEFLFALSFTTGPERQTVPVAMALMRGQYQVPWGQLLAGTVVATAPAVAVVLGFQRFIVQGLTSGAVKG